MHFKDIFQVLAVLSVGGIGAWGAIILNLPAAALLGSTVFASIYSFYNRNASVPNWVRNAGFTTIGCSLGTGITTEALLQAGRWPVSILLLAVMMICLMFVCGVILSRGFGLNNRVAALGTSPGALSYVLALAHLPSGPQTSAEKNDDNRDISEITALQTIRLLVITVLLPFIIEAVNYFIQVDIGDSSIVPGISSIEGDYRISNMSVVTALIVMSVVYLAGIVGTKFRIPAAFIIFGMVINGGLHLTDIVSGSIPGWMLTCGFIVTGAVTGVRFKTITQAVLRVIVGAALAQVSIAIAIAAAFSVLTSYLLSLPFGQVWVAFAPGGVESMAAMSLALGYDSAYVAVHHLFRIIFLILFLPIFIRVFNRIF